MAIKRYISNISGGAWSRERQVATLGGWDDISGYEDKISAVARKTKRVVDLKDRAALLMSLRAGEGDELHVASLPCLCFDTRDFLAVVAETDKACATIIDIHSGLRIEPKTRPWKLAEARDAMEISRRGDINKTAAERAAELRRARTLERIEIIRPLWKLPNLQYPTATLLEMAGERNHPMAASTARAHLGSRPDIQRDYALEQVREAGRAATRAKKAAAKGKSQ